MLAGLIVFEYAVHDHVVCTPLTYALYSRHIQSRYFTHSIWALPLNHDHNTADHQVAAVLATKEVSDLNCNQLLVSLNCK